MTDSYFRTPRVNRRSLIAAGGAAVAAAACGRSAKTVNTTPSAAGQPKRGGIFRYVNVAVAAMDPATSAPAALAFDVYEWMAVWKQSEQKSIPHLALGWEQPDASTIVFHMDPNAHWPDKAPLKGRKLTSQDVKYSLNYYSSPDPRFQNKSELAAIDLSRSETPDDATLVLHLKQPYLPQLTTLLTTKTIFVVPHEIVERDGSLDKEAIGSGPFLVDSYVQNGAVHLVRNQTYWKPGLPYLDEVQTLYIQDVATQFSSFATANVDMLQKLSFDQEKDLPKSAQVLPAPTWTWYGLRFNLSRKPFDDVRVRQAISYAVDRDALNQILYAGHSEPSAAVVPSYGKFAIPKVELLQQPGYRTPKDQDLADAKKLLDAAGVKDLAVTIVGSNTVVYARQSPEVLVDQLAKIGVKVTPDVQEFANYVRTRIGGDFSVLLDNLPGTGDPDSTLRNSYYTGGGMNFGKYSNPRLDAMIDKQALEADADRRTQDLYDIQRLLLTDLPIAMIGYDVQIAALQPYVHGVAEWVGPSLQTPYHALGQTAWLDK